MATFAPQEREYYDKLFNIIDKQDSGVLPGQDALPFLMSSNLPQQTLGEIWALADPDNNGFLTKEGWYRAARVIGWMQKGGQTSADPSLAQRAGPLPTFQGQAPPPPISAQPTGISTQVTGSTLPPLTATDRTKFTRIFVGCGPQNGLVNGDKARDVFLKSKLGYDKLGLIWNLADTQQRGSLDLPDFIIGMYLIQSVMANPALNLPTTLPPGTYEAASGGRPPPTSPIARQNTGPQSPVRPQYTGPSGILQPQRTGPTVNAASTPPRQTPSAFGSPVASRQLPSQAWDVTPEAKATSDRFFAQLDSQNKGVIEGDVAVPFMVQSQLDEGVLASIWDLADIKHEGRLGRDEFAVAMHLINQKLAGQDIPSSLPTSLIPPALRKDYPSGPAVTGTSSATKDLFDLFSDDAEISAPPAQQAPPIPAFTPQAFLPQPPSRKPTAPPSRQLSPAPAPSTGAFGLSFGSPAQAPASDLLGDDGGEPARSVPDNSAELGNKRNQLANTSKANDELSKTRGDLERQAADSASQLEELESKLTSARVKHEAETKAVADLRLRVGEQTAKLKSLNADVITAESDLTAMRLEKDELGQALLHDKEEVRQLQKKMKEVEEEKSALKGILEKLKKETRQQKGLVTIAKKQLSTAEASRDGVQKEVREAERVLDEPQEVQEPKRPFSPTTVAAGVPLPATPRALSPTQTGASQRSNNPFDRLGKSNEAPPAQQAREEKPGSPSLGTTALAAAGAAAGVVAAGAATLFTAAKDVVSPPEEHHDAAESDPFGAPSAPPPAQPSEETDPFGAPKSAGPHPSAFDTEFDDGFGDSFGHTQATAPQPASHEAPTDFDTAFADFDTKDEPSEEHVKSPVEEAHELLPAGIPTGMPKSVIPGDLRPEAERTASTQAIAATSEPHTPAEPVQAEEAQSGEPAAVDRPPFGDQDNDSSDDDEGPEDLEAPKDDFKGKGKAVEEDTAVPLAQSPPVTSQPIASSPDSEVKEPKVRRTAPPPPAAKTSAPPIDDFDPFGAPAQSAPAQQAAKVPGPKTAGFDDEDFDFSDLPPANMAHSESKQSVPNAGSTFDDEFAGFDDEFDKPSTGQASDGSTGMSKSYEMVSPNVPSAPHGAPVAPASQPFDEWGFGSTPKPAESQPAGEAFSFDDAFGGDFSPSAPTSAPQAESAKPTLPDRKESTAAQNDDIEDVKKLCAMGFPRNLVIAALDANGYDFSKALNVLVS